MSANYHAGRARLKTSYLWRKRCGLSSLIFEAFRTGEVVAGVA
jgi:hypothetical protein